jgi:hypothetical protein
MKRLKLSNDVRLSVKTTNDSPSGVSFSAFFAAISGAGQTCPFVSTILIKIPNLFSPKVQKKNVNINLQFILDNSLISCL